MEGRKGMVMRMRGRRRQDRREDGKYVNIVRPFNFKLKVVCKTKLFICK